MSCTGDTCRAQDCRGTAPLRQKDVRQIEIRLPFQKGVSLYGQAGLQTQLARVSEPPRLAAQRTARQAILIIIFNFRIFGNSGFFAQPRHTVPEPAPPHHSANVFKTKIMSQPCAKRPARAQKTRFLRKMLHFVLSAVTPTCFSLLLWEQAGPA